MHRKIKLLFMDVDGTLTDGKIYMGNDGEIFKAFDIQDGYGIHELLPQYGIIPVIITGRTSRIVENRAKELGIEELYQGKHDKVETMLQVVQKYGCTMDETAYIGDDCLDVACMKLCAISACPADAVDSVKKTCNFVCKRAGGDGAVREFIDWLCMQIDSEKEKQA